MNTTIKTQNAKALLGARTEPLRELFLNQLAEMHDAEKQLTKALPLLVLAAESADLKALLKLHLEETKGHVACLQHVADSMGEKLTKRPSKTMEGLIREAVVLVAKKKGSSCSDAALISAGQKVEHYEIASYGTLCSWAKQLDYKHELALLTSTLNQEKIADALLTKIAAGEGPLPKLVQEVSLKAAGATSPPTARRSR